MHARLASTGGLGIHPFLRIEVTDLAGDLRFVRGRIEVGDGAESRDPVDEVRPGGLLVVADGADDPDTGDDDAAVVVGSTHMG